MQELVINEHYTSLVSSSIVNDVPYKRKNLIKTKDFLKNFRQQHSVVHDDLLPNKCRIVKSIDSYSIYIIEDEPMVRTIKVNYNIEEVVERLKKTGKFEEFGYSDNIFKQKISTSIGNTYYQFNLSFPYVVYIIFVINGSISAFCPFFRLHPISSINDYLMYANLFNIPDSQVMCLGTVRNNNGNNNSELINAYIDSFWSNIFNKDHIFNIQKYENTQYICDYLTWQYYSSIDSMFIYDVDWIVHNKSISEFIDEYIHIHNSYNNNIDCSNMFEKIKTSLTKSITTDSDNKLIRNFTNEFNLRHKNKSSIISIGDEIMIDGKIFYINSFLGKTGKYIPSEIELESEDGNINIIPFNKSFIKDVINYIYKKEEDYEVEVNGFKLKSGEIIIIKEPFSKIVGINSIRKSRDGKIEARIGDDYYYLENIKFSKFDKNNISYYGTKLEIGKKYFVNSSTNNKVSIIISDNNGELTFNNIFNNDSNDITLLFNNDYIIPFEFNDYDIVDIDSCVKYDMVRSFNTLLQGTFYISSNKVVSSKTVNWSNNEVIQKSIFKSDNEIEIKGVDIDINFKVDDFVVLIDWSKEIPITLPLKINEFNIIEDLLCFKLLSLDGKQNIVVPYIDFRTGNIFTGKIRKISLDCMGLRYGDEIKARVSGVQNFPMKDINRIIGVITDVNKTPLILCSNYCTIWSQQNVIGSFDIISRNSSMWGKRKLEKYDRSKIKFQPGDFITYKDHWGDNSNTIISFIISKNNTFNDVIISNNGIIDDSLYSCDYYITMNKTRIWDFYGLLSPRYSRKDLIDMWHRKVFPNMHNGYTIDDKLRYGIQEKWEYV